uniref:alpha-glucosidase n=1 Tax=Cacopsylla melanoneura TaxID=428564 RepID=A0A8D9EXA1_9HEMI
MKTSRNTGWLCWAVCICSFVGVLGQDVGIGQDLPQLEWWQTSVFYHLYPRSFKDSNGDGVGDLKGMIEKLPEHLHDLGIGAVWLSPIFKSPMKDFGYDIADYLTFEPVFGDLDDFDKLKERLHALGIKLLLDFVPNHTSDRHEWFQKSLAKLAPYDNFYVWRDPKGYNGSQPIPPNNWVNQFKGPAWTFAPQRNQFYLHNFLPEQPDLNYNSPDVQEAINDVLRYWLKRGVDGFRIDAVPYLYEDTSFQDDPTEEVMLPGSTTPTIDVITTYARDRPQSYDQVREWRRIIDEHSNKTDKQNKFMFIEAYATLNQTMQFYDCGHDLMPFNFFLITQLNTTSTAQQFVDVIETWINNMPEGGWPNWVLDNHDNPRSTTRLGPGLVDALNALILLLPGTGLIYYGQEIGMEDTDVQWEDVQDPFGQNFGPVLFKKFYRDPERSPLQWNNGVSAGFSSNPKTWLPVNPNFYYLNVEAQKKAEVSHYNIVKRLIQLRGTKVFQHGGFSMHVLGKYVLAFKRFLENEPPCVVVINLSPYQEVVDLSQVLTRESSLSVHTASVNSEYKIGNKVPTSGFPMRPKSSLVLTATPIQMQQASPSTNSATWLSNTML